jgi:D-glycero-D-manno-heptose 1,7-bisphosphate phosphatase
VHGLARGARAVFLDRDGTLMEERNYCGDPAMVEVFPGVPEALRDLRAAGFLTVIITNQSGIGRGLITEDQFFLVQEELLRQLGPGAIDAMYFCPDVPGTPGSRRKPEPTMAIEAARDLHIDLARSFFIGDKPDDIESGRRAGARTIQVLTGYGASNQGPADYFARSFAEAAGIVLAER